MQRVFSLQVNLDNLLLGNNLHQCYNNYVCNVLSICFYVTMYPQLVCDIIVNIMFLFLLTGVCIDVFPLTYFQLENNLLQFHSRSVSM